jgi:transposase
LLVNNQLIIVQFIFSATIFVENKVVMVSKAELRKLNKEQLVNMVYDLLIRVDNLVAEVQILKEEAKVLKEEVQDLKEEVKRLKTPKNSSNSSLPPSHDLFRFKNQSLREQSGKKSGGQPGHKGETLLMSPNPDKTIEHWPDQICPQCGKIHTNEPSQIIGKRQVIDIPVIKASIIEHQIIKTICTCGYVNTGNFPAAVSAPVQYGNNLISLTAYLSSRQYVPYARLSELVRSITSISMSEGTIFNLLNRAANIVLPIYKGIKEEITKATTVGGDETGVKVKNENYWAWTWQTILATYIVITKSRGFVTVTNTFPNGFPNATYISDSLSAQLKTSARRHQLCLAHLLRELNYFEELYHHKWVIDMKAILKKAIILKNSITLEQYTEQLEERTALLQEFGILINQSLPDKVSKIFPFQKRLKKRQHQVFNFLFHPDVPYDNNGSERAIRNIKVKQKVSGSFRSERGSEIFAILRSVFDTTIKKGGNPFETIRFAVNLSACKNEFQLNRLR